MKTRARKEMDLRIAVVYVLHDTVEDRIAGFYSVSALSIEVPEDKRKGLPKYSEYPATLVGRLDIDKDYQGQGLGERVLHDALGRALAGSRTVASYAVIVDAKDDQARDFYLRYGFMPLPTETHGRRLFIPMGTVEKLFKL